MADVSKTARTAKTEAERAFSAKHGNPGGLRAAGLLFRHVIINSGRHMARYLELDGKLVCSVCRGEV